jgi:microtubule-associated protein-like 6
MTFVPVLCDQVKLFRYPCVDKDAKFSEYLGHSSHVTNVRFTPRGNILLSAGGNDRCIFQWRVDADDEEDDVREAEADVETMAEGLAVG